MDTLTAIHTRQSIGKVRPDPVPHALIEQLLRAAVQAPNHHRVRPWRFVVVTGAARERLGQAMGQALQKRRPDCPPEAVRAEAAKPLRAPLLIAVGVDKPGEPKVIEVENVCAAAAATQNLLLAAHSLGLAAKWRTGDPAVDPHVKAWLGFEPDQHLIGFLYIGFPLGEPDVPVRPGFEDRTVWLT
jgi:nitroreductase